MRDQETGRKIKKTNYQRLWRNSKKQEILAHNFAEDIVKISRSLIEKNIKDKKAIEAFDAAVQHLRDRYSEAAVKM